LPLSFPYILISFSLCNNRQGIFSDFPEYAKLSGAVYQFPSGLAAILSILFRVRFRFYIIFVTFRKHLYIINFFSERLFFKYHSKSPASQEPTLSWHLFQKPGEAVTFPVSIVSKHNFFLHKEHPRSPKNHSPKTNYRVSIFPIFSRISTLDNCNRFPIFYFYFCRQ